MLGTEKWEHGPVVPDEQRHLDGFQIRGIGMRQHGASDWALPGKLT